MFKTNNRKLTIKHKKAGFTLIELLIVIGIIAILAAAVIIAINPGRQFQQARNASRWSHMNSIVNAVYSYAISEGGTFPDCNDSAADEPLKNGTSTETELRDVWECETELVGGGFMAKLPLDPQEGVVGSSTGYMISSDGMRIKITSTATEASGVVEVIQ